ncbi:MAG: sulfotransferase [Candidatus Dojkabacteria bacterium]
MRRPDVVSKFEILTSRLRMRPQFLVIGAQKAGTSSVHSYLIEHPHVLAPKRKEVRYFGSEHNEEKGLSWYFAHFPLIRPGRQGIYITGESSPNYMYRKGTIEKIHRVLPDVKLIMVLRDPTERAISHHNMISRLRDGEFPPFEEIVDQYLEGAEIPAETSKVGFIERGYYLRQIENILEYFSRDQLKITILDDLMRDPKKESNRLYSFLGLGPFALRNYRKANIGNYETEPDKIVRQKLRRHYEPFNSKLYDFLGRNLNWNK